VLPKGIRLSAAKIYVHRDGGDIVLREKRRGLGRVYDLIRQMPSDMFDAITDDGPPQHRDGL
jgi:virulence-associated protein VagC